MPISPSCKISKSVIIHHKDLVNLYGCSIDDETKIGAFVEIQKNAIIGKKCKISSHSFVCEGVSIEDRVFVGHGVMFINDIYPQAANEYGDLHSEDDWQIIETFVREGASIGSNSTIMAGITIGKNALIGAGAVVIKDVPDFSIVAGVPAKAIGDVRKER